MYIDDIVEGVIRAREDLVQIACDLYLFPYNDMDEENEEEKEYKNVDLPFVKSADRWDYPKSKVRSS